MKKISIVLLLLFSLVLVSCKGDNSDDVEDDVITVQTLNSALEEFKDNNYKMDVDIYFYDELQTTSMLEVDGDKSHFVVDEYNEEFYQRDGRTLVTYIKDGDSYIKTEERNPKDNKYLVFDKINADWFDLNGQMFVLKSSNVSDMSASFDFEEAIEFKGATITLDSEKLVDVLRIELEHDRDSYFYEFRISNYGSVSITLPTEVR